MTRPGQTRGYLRELICLLVLGCLYSLVLRAAEEKEPKETIRETVVVSASLAPESIGQINREVVVLEGELLRNLPLRTVSDLIALAAPVDLQPRVPGVFGDIRMRGADYTGVLLCIDGVRWNDPQTAHFNLEIPVPLEMIERVEVLTGCQSVFYGSEAVGGVVNIITRHPKSNEFQAHLHGGSFGTAGAALGGVTGRPGIYAQVFGAWERSDGFITDRDYQAGQVAAALDIDHRLGASRILCLFQDNTFGADGFYGPYPSFEKTRTQAVLVENNLASGPFSKRPTRIDLSWKGHWDRFDLYRDNPSLYQNRHMTQTFSLKATSLLHQGAQTTVAAAAELSHAFIRSDRLGDHLENRWAVAGEVQRRLTSTLVVQGSLRLEQYTRFGWSWTPGAGVSYLPLPRLKVRAAYGRAFRVPSFTELYYWSPGTIGNAALYPERSDSLEAGADWYASERASLSVTVFRRYDRELIDWIRFRPNDPWQATNIGRVDVTGVSVWFDGRAWSRLHCLAGYSYTTAAPEHGGFESRYALDYARHHVSVAMEADLPTGFALAGTIKYKYRPAPRSGYTLASLRLGRQLGPVELYIQGENLFNQWYEEITSVPTPGRAVYGGLRFRWSEEKK